MFCCVFLAFAFFAFLAYKFNQCSFLYYNCFYAFTSSLVLLSCMYEPQYIKFYYYYYYLYPYSYLMKNVLMTPSLPQSHFKHLSLLSPSPSTTLALHESFYHTPCLMKPTYLCAQKISWSFLNTDPYSITRAKRYW